jgi:nicotinate-nucleotide adenylyltransferase
VGVLGGAFNPPHLGHLAFAQEAAWQLGLDGVVFVPTGEAPHKEIEADPGRGLRLEMTVLATDPDDRFTVSSAEVEREGPSYMSDTLEELAADDRATSWVLLLGSDAALAFCEWHRPDRILELAELGVACRAGVGNETLDGALARAGAREHMTIVDMPEMEVSSSEVRARVASGKPIRYLVPEAVSTLIAERGLYVE